MVSLPPLLDIVKHKRDEARLKELRTHPKRLLNVIFDPIDGHLAQGLALLIQLKRWQTKHLRHGRVRELLCLQTLPGRGEYRLSDSCLLNVTLCPIPVKLVQDTVIASLKRSHDLELSSAGKTGQHSQ